MTKAFRQQEYLNSYGQLHLRISRSVITFKKKQNELKVSRHKSVHKYYAACWYCGSKKANAPRKARFDHWIA